MESLLIECVHNSLRNFLNRNAIFLCERLCAGFPSEVNLQLMGICYLQDKQPYCAYHILKGFQMPQSRYLFALSCFQMDLLREGEAALCPINEPNSEVPNGAAGHYLLGLIYRYTDRRKKAVEHFTQALSLDPFLWAAYEELCVLGAAVESNEVFGEATAIRIHQQMLHTESNSKNFDGGHEDHVPTRNFTSDEMSPRKTKQSQGNHLKEISRHSHGAIGTSSQICGTSLALYNTPSPVSHQVSVVAPPPLIRNIQANPGLLVSEGSLKSAANVGLQAPRRRFMDEGKLRKVSGRLFSDSGPRRSTRLAGESVTNVNSNAHVGVNGSNYSSKFLSGLSSSSKLSSTTSRSVTIRRGNSWSMESSDEGRRGDALEDNHNDNALAASTSVETDDRIYEQKNALSHVDPPTVNVSKNLQSLLELLNLLQILGEGYRLSCLYKCQEALETYMKLSYQQYNTAWVLCQVGKAYFELVNYLEAEQTFSLARQLAPYKLEGMDIYSTVLYHLKEQMKLSYLAQELITTDRLSPQSWCAIGNCYSLQKDHETALKNFQRAVHLDPRFVYAHTLSGHEHIALEDQENGIKCYQSALRIDERHYNAWYGLGMVYLRQEKYEFAEPHFQKALQINPRSSILMCYLGKTLHLLKRNVDALDLLDKAILLDKKNLLPMFEKANILMSLDNFDEALRELEQLKEYAPRESSVYALMGKIYKCLNIYEKAMFHFGVALDLKPSSADAATIKSEIEKLIVPEEIEDNL